MPWIQTSDGWVRTDYTSVNIRQRLVDRFDLQEYPIDPNAMFVMPNKIQPVTNIDTLLTEMKIYPVTPSAVDPGATGYIDWISVPAGKRWNLYGYACQGSAGTITAGHIQLHAGGRDIVTATVTPEQYLRNWFNPILPLDEETDIYLYIGAYNAGDTMDVDWYVQEEDAY